MDYNKQIDIIDAMVDHLNLLKERYIRAQEFEKLIECNFFKDSELGTLYLHAKFRCENELAQKEINYLNKYMNGLRNE